MEPVKMSDEVTQPISPKAKTSAEKRNTEHIWKVIFLFLSIASAILFQKIYKFQTLPLFDGIRKGHASDLLIFSIPFAIVFMAADVLIHHYFDDWAQKNLLTDKKYFDMQTRKKKSFTIVKFAYSLIYYGISSVVGLIIIWNTSFFPQFLGGKGQFVESMGKAPWLDESSDSMKYYYLAQFGKHFARLILHLFIKAEGSYFEFGLHHSLSVFLIMFSYLTNMWLVGVLVLVIHDSSDFTLILARFYRQTRNMKKGILYLFYILGFMNWILLRVFAFSYYCIYVSYYAYFNIIRHNISGEMNSVLELPYVFCCVMMTILEVLQLFWTYYIAESFAATIVTSKTRHSFD